MSAVDLSMTVPASITTPRGRILCVDDEPNILRALAWLLQKEFEVVTAASGREGLALLRHMDFDVVISDQGMPEMCGVEFLRKVKAAAPRAMRILLTGQADLHAVLRSVNESEIYRFVSKPWNVTELPKVIAQAADIARQGLAAAAHPPALAPARAPAGAAKILVLDADLHMHALVEWCGGDLGQVVHVTNVADAIHHVHDGGIGVVVAETRVGSLDLTRFICLMQERHPQMVSVILAGPGDTDLVVELVNQGQVFRCLPKPVRGSDLRDTLRAAVERSHALLRPDAGCPPEAEPRSDAAAPSADSLAAHRAAAPDGQQGGLGGYLRRLWSRVADHG